jgi:hypothetical protein
LVGTNGDTDCVDGSIDPARRIVTQGNYQLDDGAPVREEPVQAASR